MKHLIELVKANTEHDCIGCGKPIEPGSYYIYESHGMTGIYTEHLHWHHVCLFQQLILEVDTPRSTRVHPNRWNPERKVQLNRRNYLIRSISKATTDKERRKLARELVRLNQELNIPTDRPGRQRSGELRDLVSIGSPGQP